MRCWERNTVDALLRVWSEDTEHLSSIGTAHPACRCLVWMGRTVASRLMDHLSSYPLQAMATLTLLNFGTPVPEADRGDVEKSVAHWVRGGTKKARRSSHKEVREEPDA